MWHARECDPVATVPPGRAERIAAQLAAVGIPGALEGARAYVTNPELVSRTHFARYLVDSGHARSTQAVFDRFLGEGRPGYVPHLWTTLDTAISWIHSAGGLPVLAHPGRYKLDEKGRKRLLDAFKDAGITPVEALAVSLLYAYANPTLEQLFEPVAASSGLYLSLSSDVSPEYREVERTATTVLNAYVGPVMERYLLDLARRLLAIGIDAPLHVMESSGGVPVKSWTRGVPFEEQAKRQVLNIASMPFVYRWVAVMPDVHLGKGATVGSANLINRSFVMDDEINVVVHDVEADPFNAYFVARP
mgnify:CR=1 FL=1